MEHIFTLSKAVELAREKTMTAATTKDWRLDKHGKRFREVAREINQGKGYIVCTPRELCEQYPEFARKIRYCSGPDADQKIIWAVGCSLFTGNIRKYVLDFVPVWGFSTKK